VSLRRKTQADRRLVEALGEPATAASPIHSAPRLHATFYIIAPAKTPPARKKILMQAGGAAAIRQGLALFQLR
jgi:hypothetical protein